MLVGCSQEYVSLYYASKAALKLEQTQTLVTDLKHWIFTHFVDSSIQTILPLLCFFVLVFKKLEIVSKTHLKKYPVYLSINDSVTKIGFQVRAQLQKVKRIYLKTSNELTLNSIISPAIYTFAVVFNELKNKCTVICNLASYWLELLLKQMFWLVEICPWYSFFAFLKDFFSDYFSFT